MSSRAERRFLFKGTFVSTIVITLASLHILVLVIGTAIFHIYMNERSAASRVWFSVSDEMGVCAILSVGIIIDMLLEGHVNDSHGVLEIPPSETTPEVRNQLQ